MNTKDLLIGLLVAVFVFGAYFLGAFHGQRAAVQGREFFSSLRLSLTWRGFLWAAALPACWLVLFYLFVAYVRFSLGRWPEFNQHLEGGWFSFCDPAIRYFAGALMSSLYVAPIILIGALFFRRWRHVSVYALAYGAAVGIAFGAMCLAPHPFLNWFFD